jgi:glycogen(starch) synthase
MRILHLAWEYPPVMYGGLGRHVHALATAQAGLGHDVVVITQASAGPGGTAPDVCPVRVIRAWVDPAEHDPGDLLTHVGSMEAAFVDAGEQLLTSWHPEVIHAHDWMVSHAAVTLRRATGSPLAATIHATEAGRNRGWVTTSLSTRIHAQEWWLANTADTVIACSHAMRDEVRRLFGRDGVQVIRNGIAPDGWQRPRESVQRMRRAHAGSGPLIVYTGRVEFEKGVQVLLAAMPEVRSRHGDARLVVAGRGSYLPDLDALSHRLGVADMTTFLGWVSEADLRALVAAADVAVVPSLYEPFGLVALEAVALGTPLIVSDTGGLSEFAAAGARAATFQPGDPATLAAAILADLADPAAARERASRASRALAADYDWATIARETVAAYASAVAAVASPPFDARRDEAAARQALDPPHLQAPLGRLLDLEP